MKDKKLNEKYIERDLEKEIQKYLKDEEVISIVGARRCGKTTIMRHIFNNLEKANFISFDDRKALDLFEKDIRGFIEKHVRGFDYLFIDEFQYAKQGGKQLKYIYDIYGKVKIIISGSSAPELSIQGLKYLVGRVFIFNLYPLSFEEFLRFKDERLYNLFKKKKISEPIKKQINEYYDEFLVYGGYPKVVLEETHEKKQKVLKNIYNTYLLREIKEILNISEDDKISQIIKAIALQTTGITNFNELSSFTDIKFHKLKRYLSILTKTFIISRCRPHFTNKRKELAKAPKYYFIDNGFRNIGIDDFREYNQRTDRGKLNETFVASEIIKKDMKLKYWRTHAGAETDFVIYKSGQLVPIEVKTSLKRATYGKSIKNFMEKYDSPKGFVLSRDFHDEVSINKKKVFFRPLFKIQKILESI